VVEDDIDHFIQGLTKRDALSPRLPLHENLELSE
jgi:hypothetical protein